METIFITMEITSPSHTYYEIMMLIGYPTQKIPNPQVDMSSHLVVQQYLGSLLNKHALLDTCVFYLYILVGHRVMVGLDIFVKDIIP